MYILLLALVFALLGVPAHANVTCDRMSQEGCVEIRIVVVQRDDTIPELRQLVSGERQSHEVAERVYRMTRSGEVRRFGGCIPFQVLNWAVNPTVSVSTMASYNGSALTKGQVQGIPTNQVIAPVFPTGQSRGALSSAFRLEVCGGWGSIQFPWTYFVTDIGGGVYTVICPYPTAGSGIQIRYPNRGDDPQAGVHLTTNLWRQASNNWQPLTPRAWEHVYVVIVVE
jgi:hypothetical protein